MKCVCSWIHFYFVNSSVALNRCSDYYTRQAHHQLKIHFQAGIPPVAMEILCRADVPGQTEESHKMPLVRFFFITNGTTFYRTGPNDTTRGRGKQHKKQKFLSKVKLFICSEIINNSKSVTHYKGKGVLGVLKIKDINTTKWWLLKKARVAIYS